MANHRHSPTVIDGVDGSQLPVLGVDERTAARLLSVSPNTLYLARKRGELKYYLAGKTGIRYAIDDIKCWMKRKTVVD